MEAADPVVYRGCGEPDAPIPGAGTEGCGNHSHHADEVSEGIGAGQVHYKDAVPYDTSDGRVFFGRERKDADSGAGVCLSVGG